MTAPLDLEDIKKQSHRVIDWFEDEVELEADREATDEYPLAKATLALCAVVEQLVEAVWLAQHKIRQTLEGQYSDGAALKATLPVLDSALSLVRLPQKELK